MGTAPTDVPFREVHLLERDVSWEHRPDGTVLVHHNRPLTGVPPHLPALLRRNAATVPERVWLAERRGPDSAWSELTYADAAANVDAITQALLDLDVGGRPVMVLSGNSLEHAQVQLAAMQARLPYVPVTAAYSLAVSDYGRLQAMVDLLDPAVLVVQDADAFGAALDAVAGDRWVIAVDGDRSGERVLRWSDLVGTPVTGEVEASIEAITPDTVAKYLFTSGSTGTPKAVTVTQRMLGTLTASNHTLSDKSDLTHARYVEWLPWSHVAGGNAVFCKILMSRATLYLDGGRPVPGAFDVTLRNLREISPSGFSSMPVGYAMLVDAMDDDPVLGATFFKELQHVTYSGARLPDDIYQRFQAHAVAHTGFRLPFLSGFGSTETSPACAFVYWPAERAGLIGLPQPGVELKLVPFDEGRYEVRVRSDAVTPGYYQQPDLTRAAFDEEGFFKMGDAAAFADEARPEEGLVFAGRLAEEFKLTSGVFVRVTSLRVAALTAAAPYLQDVVVAGDGQPYVALLAWPNPHALADLGVDPDTDPTTNESVRAELRRAFAAYNQEHPASSLRVRRLMLMTEPFSQELGEINDKRYVNQRRVLDLRRAAVEELFAENPGPAVLELD